MTEKLKPLPWWVIGAAMGPAAISAIQQEWMAAVPWALVALYAFALRKHQQAYNALHDRMREVAIKAVEITIHEIQARRGK